MLELLEMLIGVCPLCAYFYIAYKYESKLHSDYENDIEGKYEEHIQEIEEDSEGHEDEIKSLEEAIERKCYNHEAPFAGEE